MWHSCFIFENSKDKLITNEEIRLHGDTKQQYP
jgi:hypothetical protein